MVIAEIEVLIDNNVPDIDLGNHFESSVSLFLWSALLMLIFNVDNIFDGCLGINPKLVVCPLKYFMNLGA